MLVKGVQMCQRTQNCEMGREEEATLSSPKYSILRIAQQFLRTFRLRTENIQQLGRNRTTRHFDPRQPEAKLILLPNWSGLGQVQQYEQFKTI